MKNDEDVHGLLAPKGSFFTGASTKQESPSDFAEYVYLENERMWEVTCVYKGITYKARHKNRNTAALDLDSTIQEIHHWS